MIREETETSCLNLQPSLQPLQYLTRQLKPRAWALTPCFSGQGGNLQIWDASESFLTGLLGGKSSAKMSSSCSLETQTQVFFCTESGQVRLDMTVLHQSFHCTLKDKEKHQGLRTNGPLAPHNPSWMQSAAINLTTSSDPSWDAGNSRALSSTNIPVCLCFLSFLQ